MLFFVSASNEAYFNMAMEEYFFEQSKDEFLFLWQNTNAIVVGRYQNTAEEVNSAFVEDKHITVVRRMSGGGAMYQDMGNINYTFIVNRHASELDFSIFTDGVVCVLCRLGVPAETSGRNDIVIHERKISGSAQFSRGGRILHHGTLLFDSALETLEKALRVRVGKLESKGVKSVRMRVDNIRPHLALDMETDEFIDFLSKYLEGEYCLNKYLLTEEDQSAIKRLVREKYSTWAWNYGQSPPYTVMRERRFAGGTVIAYLVVENGRIHSVDLRGDFFALPDCAYLNTVLKGVPSNCASVFAALRAFSSEGYIYSITNGELAELLGD